MAKISMQVRGDEILPPDIVKSMPVIVLAGSTFWTFNW